jgi:probable rRNA maturation factor
MKNIEFNNIDTKTRISSKRVSHWLNKVASNYKVTIEHLSYNFCSDEHLLEINKRHLNHDYYTDIITFDISDGPEVIEGDIYISVDRVKANAKENGVPYLVELQRVMAHGLLHLVGFGDKTQSEIRAMRAAENESLELAKTEFHVEH